LYRSPAEFHESMKNQGQNPEKSAQEAIELNIDRLPGEQIRYLLGAVIQVQDLRQATRALEKLGLAIIHLPSTGAFLGRRNVTLLVGMPEGMQPAVIDTIKDTCHKRVEYISTPLEGAPMPIPLSTPITVGGAIIFIIDIERFEEF
jgi:uncharacterized protein YaaQ